MGTVVDIKIKRANKVYYAGEVLSGVVVISSKDPVQHQGILLTMEGLVNLQLSAKSVGMFEAFCNSVKPIQVITSSIEIVKPGKFPSGKTEIPFEFPLHVKGNKVLYETYHGVFVNIQYTLRCDLRRSLLAKDLTKICEFIIHSAPQKGKSTPSPVDFTITPETLQNVKERASLPKFLIRGHLNSTNCVITQPLTGELVVEYSEAAIKNIELQLVRVETCGCAEGYARDATEIQNIQIADGDVCRGLSVPIYMIFPRLFTCPTLETTNFKVEFEVNIVVLLHDDHLITENFPLKLCRI
ncbi:vacuolar protein sorting-associated protein 26C isoform X1 [Notamacropus eugenii]|uniref:vacuolar protein sorting-associated protein 26C isoform X1 n=1 Tax=Notamacropus eugenii TaxID=9315 RepID=UPI003B671D46